ncbi:MAG TPA: hypothetical protein VH298_11325, partial [Jatrophihabitans sp.]|nr:hypothetical protein [Jatrophihabitans sp.]
HAGLPAQLIITLSLTDLERRAGRATTHHGGTLSIDQALKLAAAGKSPTRHPRRRRRHPRLRPWSPARLTRPAEGVVCSRPWLHLPRM